MAEPNSIKHYPVDNGDMTLIQIGTKGSGKTILVDMKIRDVNEEQYDVASDIYNHLPTNSDGAPYVDLFVLTHPDNDHCLGFKKYIHTGNPSDWSKPEGGEPKKIVMNEIWFSEICTKRASKKIKLSSDAKEFRTEAKRRRQLFEDKDFSRETNGNRLRVVGIDTDDSDKKESWNLEGLVIDRGEEVNVGAGKALILAPLDSDIFDEDHEEDKNNSSIVIRWTVNGTEILLGGDATAHIWKHIWEERKGNTSQLTYDILLAPHHCSWHTLSYDSASKVKDPKVLPEAINALSQTNSGAYIVSSSKEIDEEQSDPPSHLAKKEYVKMLDNKASRFICLADSATKTKPPKPRDFKLSYTGVSLVALASVTSSSSAAIPRQDKPIRHG
ncbi:hypothetical protein ABMY35_09285 [Pseudoalteromonas sp. BZB3]|uniref:hypothetical protein n=1 Tax=Pseudoalteromonas sp. BZB3 TaxID=3136670 RepID=UPI0032C4570E